MVRGAAKSFAVRTGMRMRRIGSDGDVDGDGGRVSICLAEQATCGEAGIGNGFEMMAQRFSETLFAFEGGVELAAGFLSSAKAAVRQHGFHVFAGVAGDGDFEIVNRGSAVQCEARRIASTHEIDENRGEAALDDVTAEPPDNHFFASAGADQSVNDRSKRIGRENVRERIEKVGNASAGERLSEMFNANLAAARLDGDGLEALKTQRRMRILAHTAFLTQLFPYAAPFPAPAQCSFS